MMSQSMEILLLGFFETMRYYVQKEYDQEPFRAESLNSQSVTGAIYRPEIDGLRAIAILLVLVFHVFPGYPTGGYVGVDIFFVISGYLISNILIRDLRSGRFSLLSFYARRCRRIVPALALVMTAVLGAGYLLLLPTEYAEAGLEVAGGAGFVSNLLFWQQTGYFDAPAMTKPLLHLWSLGVEEQFYFIWPLFLWLCFTFRLNIGRLVFCFMTASFAIMCLWTGPRAFYLLPSRFWELLLGGALAWMEQFHVDMPVVKPFQLYRARMPFRLRLIKSAPSMIAICLLGWCVFFLGFDPTYPDLNALAPTAAAFLLIATRGQDWITGHVLASRPFVFVGRISYPLYLWHWPLLSFAHIIVGARPPIETRVALLILAFLLATLTWLLIERPMQTMFSTQRIRGMKYGAALLIGPSVLILALIGGGGFAIDHAGGIPSHHRQADILPMDGHQSQFNRMVDQMQLTMKTCGSTPPPGITWCFANNPTKASFALYGDSHAYQYTPSLLDPATAADGWLLLGRPGCPPVLHIDVMLSNTSMDCVAQNDWTQTILEQRRDITTVVMSSLTTPYFRDGAATDFPPPGALRLQTTYYTGNPADVYYQGLRDSITRLQTAGKRVVLVIDNPELGFTAERCLGRRRLQMLLAQATPQCAISRADYLAKNTAFREMAARLKAEHPGLLVYDPVDTFCGPQDCQVMREGRSLFNDTSHLSEYGARLAGARLLTWIADQGIPISEHAKTYAALLSQH